MTEQSFLILLLIFIAAFAGYKINSLSLSGFFAAMVVGLGVNIGFGSRGLMLLGSFFASSSLWSKYKSEKKSFLEDKVAKGERRDWIQVFANGGIPALVSLLSFLFPADLWLFVFIISIAAANADTWASEIGSLSREKPFLVTSFRRVEPGTSGGVTLLGTSAGFAGACFIVAGAIVLWDGFTFWAVIGMILIGFLGNLLDTLLGAAIQATYVCQVCGIETEKLTHCGKPTVKNKGLHHLFNNDMINFLSIALSAVLGAMLF